MMQFNKVSFTGVILAVVASGMLSTMSLARDTSGTSENKSSSECGRTISDALKTVSKLTSKNRIPSSVSKSAECVAIFPKVVTAALAVGGTHGDGIAFCKNRAAEWGNPLFLNLDGGSIGVQAGVKKTDVVLFITGDKARAALSEGSFKLTGDLNVVAGSFDESFVAPSQGVVAFSENNGAFVGAAIGGVNISHDQSSQKEAYGSYNRGQLFGGELNGRLTSSVKELQRAL